jgi:hypothetical protein
MINLTDSLIGCKEYGICKLVNSDTGDDGMKCCNKGNSV